MKKILIIGNMGYVGSELVRYFYDNNILVDGLDNGLFATKITNVQQPEIFLRKQIYLDARLVTKDLLINYDIVIYLAAISNDPMGEHFKNETIEINYKAAVKIAKMSKKVGVKKFIFASSCSVYGDSATKIMDEESALNPLTTYAKTKAKAEIELEKLATKNFLITSLRFATACGTSSRLRLDLVVNDFIATSYKESKVTLMSRGNAYRPFISVNDMCKAFHWSVVRNAGKGGNFCKINVGHKDLTTKVIDLAEKISFFSGSKIKISKSAKYDKRSYRVNYKKFYQLADKMFLPSENFKKINKELLKTLEGINYSSKHVVKEDFMRLISLTKLIKDGKLNKNLSWRT